MVDLIEGRWRTPRTGEAWSAVAAAVLPLVTCAILAGFRDNVTSATAALILVLWVVAAAASGDRVAGVLAALSGGIWFDFFLTEPYQRFTISDPDDVEVTVLLVLIGVVVNEIALWGRRQQSRAARSLRLPRRRAGRSQAGVRGRHPAPGPDRPRRSPDHRRAGRRNLPLRAGPVHDTRFAILDHDGELTRGGHVVNVDRIGLPFDEEVAIVVRRGPRMVGHFLVTPPRTSPTPPGNSAASLCCWPTRSPPRSTPERSLRSSGSGRRRHFRAIAPE